MAETENANGESKPIVIKKYANRRLYNTATSRYVTLDCLAQMVKDGADFVVKDAKSDDDITRSVLTQIIVEQEAKGQHLLPINFLRRLISLYGDNLQWMVPNYLDHTMQAFAQNQDRMRRTFQETVSGMFPFNTLEEVGKQNMAMFERAMRMFSPYGNGEAARPPAERAEMEPAGEQSLKTLQRRLDELQQQLDAMSAEKSGRR